MTVTIPTTDLSVDDIKLSDIEMWIRPDREGIFAKLRAEAPITFQDEFLPPPEMKMPQGPGYWALTRYADVMQVSRDPTRSTPRRRRRSPTSRPRSPSGSAR